MPTQAATTYPDIGAQVKQMREMLGMSQAQLARRAGMKQSAVAGIESGKRRDLRLSTIQRLTAGLNGRLFIGLMPEANIQELLDKRSGEMARKIVLATSGSAAIEMQLPDREFLEAQIEKIQKEILKKHKSVPQFDRQFLHL